MSNFEVQDFRTIEKAIKNTEEVMKTLPDEMFGEDYVGAKRIKYNITSQQYKPNEIEWQNIKFDVCIPDTGVYTIDFHHKGQKPKSWSKQDIRSKLKERFNECQANWDVKGEIKKYEKRQEQIKKGGYPDWILQRVEMIEDDYSIEIDLDKCLERGPDMGKWTFHVEDYDDFMPGIDKFVISKG